MAYSAYDDPYARRPSLLDLLAAGDVNGGQRGGAAFGQGFVSQGNEALPPIRSVADAVAHNDEMDRRMRGPMFAQQPMVAAPAAATRPRTVATPASPLGRLLEEARASAAGPVAAPTSEVGTPLPVAQPAMRPTEALPYPGVTEGNETRGWRSYNRPPGNDLESLHGLQRDAPANSKIERGPSGNWEVAAPKKPSRLKQGLLGLLYGAAQAAAEGPTEGAALRALGGAGAGATLGGVKPGAIQTWSREQELKKSAADIAEQQGIEMRQAQIAEAQSRPELGALRVQHQLDAEKQRQADREADNTRADSAATQRGREATERERHNKVMENKKPPTSTPTRTLGGQIFEKGDDDVWHVAKGSPPPAPTAAADRSTKRSEDKSAKAQQASTLYKKGEDYWNQAQAKRKEAEGLQKKRFLTDPEKSRLSALTREAEGLEAKTREVQLKGDDLAAESEAINESAPKSGRTIEGAIEAFKRDPRNKSHRAPTEDELARMRKAL